MFAKCRGLVVQICCLTLFGVLMFLLTIIATGKLFLQETVELHKLQYNSLLGLFTNSSGNSLSMS